MSELIRSSAPHIHSKNSTARIMRDVLIALAPAAIASVILYGLQALLLILVCVCGAALTEYVYGLASKKGNTVKDCSALVTGLLLALNLPANTPLWQALIGSVFAIAIVKCLFGGIGKNPTNPAITARVFMLLVFPAVAGGVWPMAVDAVSSATPLELIKTSGQLPSLGNMLLGLRGGAIGEGCIIAILLGYAWLCCRQVIRWYVPLTFIGTVFVLDVVYFCITGNAGNAVYDILSGGLFLGAVFMATDYVTTPITNKGKVVFCLGCGVITFVIRRFLNYPEGVSFSILCMNLLVPFIEKVTKNKILGGGKK